MKALLPVTGVLCMPLKFYITSKSHRLINHDTKREKASLLSGHNTVRESISDIIDLECQLSFYLFAIYLSDLK